MEEEEEEGVWKGVRGGERDVLGGGVGGEGVGYLTCIFFQFNFICIALNHHYSLKGLNRQNMYLCV